MAHGDRFGAFSDEVVVTCEYARRVREIEMMVVMTIPLLFFSAFTTHF